MASKTIYLVFDQDGEPMDAFKKKPTFKFIKKYYGLDELEVDDDIVRDILDTVRSVKLH
jgi:hypothetical protein